MAAEKKRRGRKPRRPVNPAEARQALADRKAHMVDAIRVFFS